MLRLISFLIVATGLAWLAVWLANHPGTVAIDWLGRTGTYSVGEVVAYLLIFAAAVVLLFELFRWLKGLPGRVRISRSRNREVRGYEELTRGLMAAAAGDLAAARTHHRQAERHLPESPGIMLLAAQTAQLEGKEEVAHLKFRQMLDRRDTEFLGLRGLIGQTMKSGNQDEALELARRAYRRSPTTPWVLSTLFELLARADKWDEALGLVNEMQSQGMLDDQQGRHRRAILHHMLATRLRQEDRIDEALSQARKAVKAEAGFAPAAVQAAELAMQQGRRRLALSILEAAWRQAPHPDIGRAYAQLDPGETPVQRLQRVDGRLAPLNRDHAETLLLQGELAAQAHQWDVARTKLDAALQAEPTARMYRAMAELERAATGNEAQAQEWLSRAMDAPADKTWVCEDTGEIMPSWQPFAPSGRFDGVRWSSPPKLATLMAPEETSYIVARDTTLEVPATATMMPEPRAPGAAQAGAPAS